MGTQSAALSVEAQMRHAMRSHAARTAADSAAEVNAVTFRGHVGDTRGYRKKKKKREQIIILNICDGDISLWPSHLP